MDYMDYENRPLKPKLVVVLVGGDDDDSMVVE